MIRRRVTLHDYEDLKDYWVQHPRADWLMAAQMKYKPPARMVRRTGAAEHQASGGQRQPPTGAIAALFGAMGGKPGQTVAGQ
jgi:hypothetical protein